jgi:hypothetical protein
VINTQHERCRCGDDGCNFSWNVNKTSDKNSISLKSTSILSSHLCLAPTGDLFPSCFKTKIVYTFLTVSICATYCPFQPPGCDHLNTIWWWIEIMKLHIMQFSPFACYFLPLGSKYSQRHVFKHPQSWRWRQYVHLIYWYYTIRRLQGAMIQKTTI